MKIYRIVKEAYKDDLSGEGARLFGGRWNNRGDAMLYFSEHLSLCVLEILVHLDYQFIDNDFYYIEASIPKENLMSAQEQAVLLPQWNALVSQTHTENWGSLWLKNRTSLAMAVPSVVLPQENNILVNPKHPLISKLEITKVERLKIDERI
ncbi:hypothetical protein ULMS_12490 [Patiriisocius marinistellae]|uniref:RES domain-containing protein n=1 Tax=Patiriisocius marinistellae TaxID=2494560 RepID=A0A5J4G157_9FLAO|nr:RES family NAD+ phosphorylase [Patiriisocius marinistellae]GEQ85741.1 hypothetical protein ULMS_12490 [Patiriisocius marinistellae]